MDLQASKWLSLIRIDIRVVYRKSGKIMIAIIQLVMKCDWFTIHSPWLKGLFGYRQY